MKKGITLLLVIVVLVFAAHSFVRAAEVIKLKAANYLPVTHPMSVLSRMVLRRDKKAYQRTGGDHLLSRGYAPHSGQDVRWRNHGHLRHGPFSYSIYAGPLSGDGSIRSTSRVPERLGGDNGGYGFL